MKNSYFIKQVHSTNEILWEMLRKEILPHGYVVFTDFQTKGKGQAGNFWESEKAKNLLFSQVFYPNKIPMDQIFLISQLVSVAIVCVLNSYTNGITVKWPNDIYWNEKKLAGILIENSLQGNKVKSVIGIGLNVNQIMFRSDAPNPVSLRKITGKSVNRKGLIEKIRQAILLLYSDLNAEAIRKEYVELLYRRNGYFNFGSGDEIFNARIITVHPDGQLELETRSGEQKFFFFKEVRFL